MAQLLCSRRNFFWYRIESTLSWLRSILRCYASPKLSYAPAQLSRALPLLKHIWVMILGFCTRCPSSCSPSGGSSSLSPSSSFSSERSATASSAAGSAGYYFHFVEVRCRTLLGIRIPRIRIFLGLPVPDLLVRGMDLDPDPSLFS